MEIKSMILQTANLKEMKSFYINTLGCSLLNEDNHSFRIRVGTSELEFTTAEGKENPYYHFAFNIPANKFQEAKSWAMKRVNLLVEEGKDEINFPHLPADAIYFNDPSCNIVEFICRYEIAEDSTEPFSINSLINISEIGLIVENTIHAGEQLKKIGVTERDNNDISRKFLNFMGDRSKGIFIILTQPGRRWIFSDQKSVIFPLEIILMDHRKIIVNSSNELLIYTNENM